MAGFVYVWMDLKKKRFYVGSHWGPADDGYVCSSNWMKRSYKNRPETFKRRIVARVTTTRKDLFDEEQRWLDMIDHSELGKRYYNLTDQTNVSWWGDPNKANDVRQKLLANGQERGRKISLALRGRKLTEDQKANQREARAKLNIGGWKLSEETKRRQGAAKLGCVVSNETRSKISVSNRGKRMNPNATERMRQSKIGTKFSAEHCERIRQANLGKKLSIEHREKIRQAWQRDGRRRGLPKPRVSCPHCGKEGGKPAMTRFHFDRCPERSG